VGYFFDAVARRWAPQDCEFAQLPQPEAGTDDTYIVDAEVQDTFGVAYAFAWVRDAAGNISRRASFDVISFIPDEPGRLNRNDSSIFRIPLAEGESLDFTFTPDFGDVDVAVFDDFTNPQAALLELSSNRGSTPEQISLEGPGRFQIEVGARENSRFDIDFGPGAAPTATVVSAASPPLIAPDQQAETP